MKPNNPALPYLLLLPALVLLAAFTHYPTISTFWASLHSTPKGKRAAVWVGLENYEAMIADPIFWQSLVNNLWFALGTIPVSIALALAMAWWVHEKIRGRGFLRMAYFLPTVLPMIAVANIWLFFFTPTYGLLEQVGALFGAKSHNWLGDKSTALACVTLVAVWKEAGFFMIFYLAALQGLDPALREASTLDGANRWTYFRRIALPLLMPTTLFVLVNAVINAFRMIDHIVVMTRGGPDNSTSLLLFHLFEVGFRFWDTAYASAITVALLLILGLIALFQFAVLDRRIHYR